MPLRTSCAFLTGVVALSFAASASALEPEDVLFFKTGPLSIRPQLGLAEQYNDNLFYQNRNQVEDFVTIVSPGLKFQLGRPEHNFISFGYTLDQLFYAENPDLDAPQHIFDLRSQYEGEHWSLVGSDRFQILSSPLGGITEQVIRPGVVVTASGMNVDRIALDDTYTLTYNLGEKASVYTRLYQTYSDYQSRVAIYDIETFSGTGGFGYRAFPKTIFFGELYYGQTRTEPNEVLLLNNPRLDFLGGYLGARGAFTPKVSGTVKVGYETREFSDGSSVPSVPVVDISLTQRFSEKQALTLTYSRQNNVSIQYSRQTYTADTVGLQFAQILGQSHKWQGAIGASYGFYDYQVTTSNQTASQYDYLRGTITLAYQVQRWLTAIAGYEHEQVFAQSRGVVDYSVNRVTLRLAIGY